MWKSTSLGLDDRSPKTRSGATGRRAVWCSSPTTCFRTRRCCRTSPRDRSWRRSDPARRSRPRRSNCSAGRSGGQARPVPVPALRRSAAAGRHRPCAGATAEGGAVRRADVGAGPRTRRGGARRDQGPRDRGVDAGGRHPRDPIRPPGCRPGAVHRPGSDPGEGSARGGDRGPREERTRQFLQRILNPL